MLRNFIGKYFAPYFYERDVINQLNRYLSLNNRDLIMEDGYCHGLTLLWLYKMATDNEKWFYSITQKIIWCNSLSDFKKIEKDLEYIISFLVWARNPHDYVSDTHQLDMEKLTELNKNFSLSALIDGKNLDEVIDLFLKQENLMILISGLVHTIGIYKKNQIVYFFSSRFGKLQPKIIAEHEIKLAIVESLFRYNYMPTVKLPLHVMLLTTNHIDNSYLKQRNKEIYKNLIQNRVNQPGLYGATNLHLACEAGDKRAVKKLLKAGADPNQMSYGDWSPLHVATAFGSKSMVKLLLKFGAIPAPNKKGITPLDLVKTEEKKQWRCIRHA